MELDECDITGAVLSAPFKHHIQHSAEVVAPLLGYQSPKLDEETVVDSRCVY